MVTLKDIAKAAHVNVSTVSKALHGSSDLNEQTIATIQEIAKSLGYHLRHETEQKKRSRVVGVVVPEINESFYSMILDSLQSSLKEHKFDMLVMQSQHSKEEELHCIKQLLNSQVSSIVLFSGNQIEEDKAQNLQSPEYPPIDLSYYLEEMSDSATGIKQDVVTTNHSYERWGLGVASLVDGILFDNPRYIGVNEEEVGQPVTDLWIRLDLKDRYLVNKLVYYSYALGDNQGLPKDYSVEVSLDGEIWKTVYEETDHSYQDSLVNECPFPATEARYVRFNVYQVAGKCDVGEYVCLREIQIYGEKAGSERNVPRTFSKIINSNPGVSFFLVTTAEGPVLCDTIYCDEDEIVGKALNHLVQLGHRRIAYIGDRHSEKMKESFLNFMESNGISIPDEYIVENESRYEKCGADGLNRLLTCNHLPTAVFTSRYEIAVGTISMAEKSGINIPGDLSIVSVSDTPQARYINPSLTTVRLFGGDFGQLVTSLITSRNANPTKKREQVRVKPRLIYRDSTTFV